MKRNVFVIYLGLAIGLLLSACTAANGELSQSEDSTDGADADNSKVEEKVFEGCYFDESVYQYYGIPESESPLVYCEIVINNVTNTSFDFTIYEKVMATGESEMIVSPCTAVFIEDGARAAYYGDHQTLYFTFPDKKDLYPKHIEILGIERMEGKTYINNTILGHESG